MHRIARHFLTAVLVVTPISLQAGVITTWWGGVSGGPGQSLYNGSVGTATPNNDNSSVSNPNLIDHDLTFGSPGYFEVYFSVENSGGATEYDVTNNLANLSGINWTGMLVEIGFGQLAGFVPSNAGDLLDFDTPDRDPAPSSAAMGLVIHEVNYLYFQGNQASGASNTMLYSLDVPDYNASIPASAQTAGGYNMTLRFTPQDVNSDPIPEPATYALIGSGLAAFALVHRRTAKRS